MAGIDDHVAIIGDWVPPDPSPRTFFSSIMGDDFGSRSFPPLLGGDSGCEGSFVGSSKNLKEATILEEEDGTGVVVSGDPLSESSYLSYQKSGSRGGLAERMAARAGFSAPRLNTARINSVNVSLSPDVRSPYLTIPPGLSPTTLLDSPVFLSNSLDQPSPTTGKLSFTPSSNSKSSMLVPEAPDRDKDSSFEYVDTSSFVFKPRVESSSSFFPSAANEETPATNPQQSFANIEESIHSERTHWSRSLEGTEVHSQNINSIHPWADFPKSSGEKDTNDKNATSEPRVCDPVIAIVEHSPTLNDQQDSEGNQRSNGEINSIVEGGATSEDGYNWRKYGQKQVKGSEYPRSYYKCTHPNCQVKKKVERSHEGHITEIIYKGAHNHPKPPPNRRSAVGCSNAQNDMQLDIPEHARAQAGAEGDPTWANSQRGNVSRDPDWRHENLEATSLASVGPDFCPQSTSMQAQKGPHFEATIDVDVSSTMSNNGDENDQGTQRSVSLGYDGEGDESESKRRKLDEMEVGGAAARAIREPRVVVQTTSEVDILDDGYRWRKYGQKVVKGNPNPRSYYKCTNAGCTVRKHVERASHDLKSVITTYEGKHNHDVPAARSSSHVSSCPSSTAPTQAAQLRIHRPEPSQINDGMVNFNGPASVGAFSLPGRGQLGPSPGFSFGMRQPGLAGLTMAGLGPGLRKLPASPLHPFLGQQHHVNETGLIMPKGEPKNEPVSETGLNLSNSSSVYHQIMGRLPLGSQM